MTRTRKDVESPRVRLLWDEDLSVLVPSALRALNLKVTYIGSSDDGVPAKGTSDADVVAFAKRTHQVVVTKNHDMMTLCHEAGQPFVWLDPRGRQLNREAQVLLVFSQIRQWDALFAAGAECVRAQRTKCSPIESAEAARLALNRMRALDRRRRTKRRSARQSGSTLLDQIGEEP